MTQIQRAEKEMSLAELMIAQIEASGLNDYDQRSALGMARTWVDKKEPVKWNPNQIECPKRDQLAKDLVTLMEANPASNEEYVEALLTARKKINEPFLSNAMLGFQARRAERGILGSAKKNEKNA